MKKVIILGMAIMLLVGMFTCRRDLSSEQETIEKVLSYGDVAKQWAIKDDKRVNSIELYSVERKSNGQIWMSYFTYDKNGNRIGVCGTDYRWAANQLKYQQE